MVDDIYIRYLRQYYKENGTINDFPYKAVVEFEGKTLNIYDFFKNIRNRRRAYIGEGRLMSGYNSELSISRYKALDEMGYDWNANEAKKATDVKDEIEVRFLRAHYAEYGTINDIPYGTEVEFEGKILKIGSYLKTLRERHVRYVVGDTERFAASEISVARYAILDEMNFDWEPNKRIPQKKLMNDVCLRFLREHYAEFGTIDDITSKLVVEYEGQELKIGRFLEQTRIEHRKYLAGNTTDSCGASVMVERYKALDAMNFIWEVQPQKADMKNESDPCMEYLKQHYQEHGTINNITSRMVVEFNGITLNIGDFLCKMRYNHECYLKGDSSRNYASELSIKRYQQLEEMGFAWVAEKRVTAKELAEKHCLSLPSLLRLSRKFDGDLDKAVKFALLKRKMSSDTIEAEERETIDSVLKTFGVDEDTLFNYLSRRNLRTGEKKDKTLYYSSMTLKEYCLQNGLNYDIIAKAVRLKKIGVCDEPLDSLINRCVAEFNASGQRKPSTWIYSKYGNEILVKHMLLLIGFDSSSILRDMSNKAITLEEAFSNESFKRYSGKSFRYLEGIYEEYINFYHQISGEEMDDKTAEEALVSKASMLINDYHLNKEEFDVIRNAFFCYTEAVHQYHLFEVGFEKDSEKRVEKAIKYRLDADDIEEAFFIPLKFDERGLIGRDTELYQRRVLLKNLTVSWNDLTEEERTVKIGNYNLSEEELHYISSTRKDIDVVKEKVLSCR